MKKIRFMILVSALVFSFSTAANAASDYSPFSLGLGLSGRGAFGSSADMSFAGGIGASLYGDWRPVKWFSIGTCLSYTEFPGDKAWRVATWDFQGRLFPFGPGTYGEWYAQGTLGWNFLGFTIDDETPGAYHAGWGFGYLLFLGENMAMDFSAAYDMYSPFRAATLHSVGAKVGVTWFLGNQNSEE